MLASAATMAELIRVTASILSVSIVLGSMLRLYEEGPAYEAPLSTQVV